MIAVDTNVLLHAQRRESALHRAATAKIQSLVDDGQPVGIPWPCLYEFLRLTTHPRVYDAPTPVPDAMGALAGANRVASKALAGRGWADVRRPRSSNANASPRAPAP